MSTKSFASAHDLGHTELGDRGFMATLSLLWSALVEARDAKITYCGMTSHGMDPAAAAAETFRQYYRA